MTLPTMLPHTRADVLAWCRGVDAGAWTSLAVPERITYTSHDTTVQLAAAAALTERVRLWTTIVILPAHDAVAVAKQMASVDVLSDGRLTMGVGIGGREHDYRAINASFAAPLPAHGRAGRDHAAHLERRATVRGRRSGRASTGTTGWPSARRRRVRAEGDRARGAMGRRRQRRVDARREPGRDGRRVRRRSVDAWRDAGRAEPPHLSSSIWYALGPDAEEQLHSYAYDYLKIFGDEIGQGAASMATCFGADALRQTARQRARRRRRRVLPRPHHRRSRRAGADRRRARRLRPLEVTRVPADTTTSASVDRMLEEVAAETGPRRLRRPVVPRRARAGVGVGHHAGRAHRARARRARRPVPRQPREPAAGHRLAPPSSRSRREESVEQPICIVGLSRTGTTALSHLLACDPDNRSLLGWEAGQSVPPPTTGDVRRRPAVPALRARPTACSTSSTRDSRRSTTTHPTGRPSARCSSRSTSCPRASPRASTFPTTTSGCSRPTRTPAYEYHRQVLQVLQSEYPGRWQLKTPVHCLFIGALADTYPDARFVVTHRDPVKAVASVMSLVESLTGTFSDADHHEYIAEHWPMLVSGDVQPRARLPRRQPRCRVPRHGLRPARARPGGRGPRDVRHVRPGAVAGSRAGDARARSTNGRRACTARTPTGSPTSGSSEPRSRSGSRATTTASTSLARKHEGRSMKVEVMLSGTLEDSGAPRPRARRDRRRRHLHVRRPARRVLPAGARRRRGR